MGIFVGRKNSRKMSILYYYYYLFYQRIMKDSEPHLLTTLALSASESFLFITIFQIPLVRFYCINLNIPEMIAILALIILANYIYYHRKGNAVKIIKNKPKFFSSNKFSILITILFFLITSSCLFWGPVYLSQLNQEFCK
jgi:hypothetical protein